MTPKQNFIILLLLVLGLTACAAGQDTPTPTIVRLTRSATAETQARLDDAPPTATRLPLPSPTPTLTPLPGSSPVALATATPLPAAAAPQAQVVTFALNIRQGPGVNYAVIGTAQNGDVFDITGINGAGTWFQIVTQQGETGWISGQEPYTRLLAESLDEVPIVQAPPLEPAAAATPAAKTNSTAGNSQLNGKLIFMTGSGGQLYSVNVDGSNLRRLANSVIDPVVSPNGKQVAFTRWDGAEFGALFTINVDGTGERAIVNDIRQPKSPTWSPDGQEIVLSFQQGGQRDPSETCRNFERGQEVNIPRSRVTITDVDVKGDGGIKICYQPFEDLHWQLRRVNVSTGEFEDLPSDDYSYNPAWDPQNPWRIIFDGSWGLVQTDLNTGQNWPLTGDLRDTGPVFSPDGQMLALTYKQHDHWEVYTYNLETQARRRLTKPPILADPQYNSASPAWSPDGSQIAFVTDRTGSWEIWVMNADGSNQRPLLPPEIQARLDIEYRGVNERMLNWIE